MNLESSCTSEMQNFIWTGKRRKWRREKSQPNCYGSTKLSMKSWPKKKNKVKKQRNLNRKSMEVKYYPCNMERNTKGAQNYSWNLDRNQIKIKLRSNRISTQKLRKYTSTYMKSWPKKTRKKRSHKIWTEILRVSQSESLKIQTIICWSKDAP